MHGHYLYRLSVRAVGSSLLRYADSLDEGIDMYNNRKYNYGGSWRNRKLNDYDIQLLNIIKQATATDATPSGIKIRIEDPNIQFYSVGHAELVDLATKLHFDDNAHFESFMQPDNADNAKLLADGFVLKKKKIEWPYRLIVRDGRYSTETKQSLKRYLQQLGTDIKVPKSLWEQLDRGGWIWGGYIYLKDNQLATIFQMIEPRLVAKVEEFRMSSA